MNKKILVFLLVVFTLFIGFNSVNALTNEEEQFISDEVLKDVYYFEFFEEGSLPSMHKLVNYSIDVSCFNFSVSTGLQDFCIDYIIDSKNANDISDHYYRVPAEIIESSVSKKFQVDEEFFEDFRVRFAEGDYNNTGTFKYVEYEGEHYYEFTVFLGLGGYDYVDRVTKINDLGNNYYLVEHYYAIAEDMVELTDEYKIPENPIEGVDYVMACSNEEWYGECESEKRFFIIEKYNTKVHYDGENVRFVSYKLASSQTSSYFSEGADQKFDNKEGKKLVFRIDIDFSLFDKVYINGVEVDPKYYAATEGSTVITFNDEYTKTLKNGNYELKVTFKDGTEAETTFTVANTVDNTKTGLYTGIGLAAGIALIGCSIVFVTTRKQSKFPQA